MYAIGGLPEALERAAELASVSEYRLQEFPRYKSGLERLLDDMGMSSQARAESVLESGLGSEWAEVLRRLKTGLNQEGMQARLPFTLKIR